ncbi:MAG: putative repeat protein (TIGR01451 family) [Congregibacter sp.]
MACAVSKNKGPQIRMLNDNNVASISRRRSLLPRSALRLVLATAFLGAGALASPVVSAQVNNFFTVAVTTSPDLLPNSGTVLPGEQTSLRITLQNEDPVNAIINARYTGSLPSTASRELVIDGSRAATSTCGGTLLVTPGLTDVEFSGVDVPAQAGSAPGLCFVDLPVIARSLDGLTGTLAYTVNGADVLFDTGQAAGIGEQSITLLSASVPSVAKSFPGGSAATLGGDGVRLRIRINNTGASAVNLTNVSLEDVFPQSGSAGAIIAPDFSNVTTTCSGSPMVGPLGVGVGVAVSGVDVAAGTSCDIEVDVNGLHTDGAFEITAQNRIEPSSFTSDQGLRPSSAATRNVTVRSPLAISKAFANPVVASGQSDSFMITFTNAGSTPITINSLTDNPLANGQAGSLQVLDGLPSSISTSCSGTATVTVLDAGDGFQLDDFVIPARAGSTNGSCSITVQYSGAVTDIETPEGYTNLIRGNTDSDLAFRDVDIANAGVFVDDTSATVIIADRLRVLKSRSFDPPSSNNAAPGEPVRYRVTVQNFSDAILNDLTLNDTLTNASTLLRGGSFEPVSFDPSDPANSAVCNALTVAVTALPNVDPVVNFGFQGLPGRASPSSPGQCAIEFWVMIDPDATSATTNSVVAGGACFNSGAICNGGSSNTVSTSLRTPIEFEKTFDGLDSVTKPEGVAARLRLEVRNFATSSLSGVALSDDLPSVVGNAFAQLRIASPANISNSCGGSIVALSGTTSLELDNGVVPAFDGSAGVCAIEVDVVGPAGVYSNTGRVTGGQRTNADGSTTLISPVGSFITDDADITYESVLVADKSFSPDRAGSGGKSTVSVVLENRSTNQPLTGISVTDPLPAGMVVASPANAYTTCAGSLSISASSGAGSVTLTDAVLPAQANCALVFDVSVTGSADWTNVIPAGNIVADKGILNTAPITDTLIFEAPAEPSISKQINPGAIVPGQSATLTINITNGAQSLSGVTVVDWFTEDGLSTGVDNGMRVAPDPRASTNCTSGIVTAVPGGSSVRLSDAALAGGQACEVRVQITSLSVGTIINRIPFNAIESDQGATNSSTSASSSLTTSRSVGVSKLFTPSVVSPSEVSRLRIEILNGDEQALTDVSLTDVYPAGLVNAPDPNPISNCGGAPVLTLPTASSITLTNGALAAAVGNAASSCFIEVNVSAATEGSYLNEIPADTLTIRGVPVSHPPTSTTLQVRERIIVNKAIDSLTLDVTVPSGFSSGTATRLPGVVAPLTIRLENPNTLDLTEVQFTDNLPDGLTLAATPNLATTCTDAVVTGAGNGRALTLTGATLAAAGSPGAICTVTADVFSNVPGVYTNEIPAGDVTSFEGVDNDPPTQAQIVVSEPPTVSKDFDPPVIPPNGTSTLRITLGNDNDIAGTLTDALVDMFPTLPGAMVVAATPNDDIGSCAGTFTANAGEGFVTLASGATIPPGGCVLSVDVTAAEPGDYLNNIPVGALQSNLGPNYTPTEAPLKLSTLGFISGKVFLDPQTVPDGLFIAGDSTPIAGNTIELRNGASCSGALLESTSTDAQGNYLFDELPAGTYSVCQTTQPPSTLNSITTEGTITPFGASTGTPGSASNPSTTTSQITGIVLGDNAGTATEVSGSPDNNFSEIVPATISGNVYFDRNDDGVLDAGEPSIGGVEIRLTGPVTVTTTTAADGSWSFSGLPPGDYTVTEVQPGGWADGQDTRGTVGGLPEGDDALSDVISLITLGPGDAGVEYNFGEIAPGVLALSLNAVCINDVPYVDYSIVGFAGESSPSVTVRWVTLGASTRVAEQLTNQPGSGRLLWPGASVDTSGNGTGWPGWAFTNGQWVQVADDRIPAMTLEVEFNPTGSGTVTYPPATPACAAQPRGTFKIQSVPTNPRWLLILMAMMLVVAASPRLAGVRA